MTGSNPGALDGLRVVDFGHWYAGPLTAMLLADAGAEVVHIDRPGDPRRHAGSSAVLQRGKLCIELDLSSGDGLGRARQLVDAADVLIENFRPEVMDRLGLGADACMARNRGLIYCSLPGFAPEDPRAAMAAWEPIVAAATSISRPPRRGGPAGPELESGPAVIAAPLLSSYAAIIAAHSIVAALLVRQRDGRGQQVCSPLFDAAFEIVGHEPYGPAMRAPGLGFVPPTRPGTAHYRCADGGWLHLCLFDDRHLRWFGDVFGPGLASPELFDAPTLRAEPALQDELYDRLCRLFASRAAAAWEAEINQRSGAPVAVCQSASDWLLHDRHARQSGAVVAIEDPLLGSTSQLGCAVTMDRTPLHPGPRRIGQRPDWSTDGDSGGAPAAAAPPLDGMRVVDFTQVLAGPTCGRVLAEYGASVVKVNKPADLAIPWHGWINRGKQSVLADIADPATRPLMERLLASADVVSQNFTPGVADRLGIGERDVRALRSDVVYCSISAFGSPGFRSGWRGREELGQAVTGLQTAWANTDGEPTMHAFPLSDIATGHLGAFGVLLALFHRHRTGVGQAVSASLAHTATVLQAPDMIEHTGRVWDGPSGHLARGWGPGNRLHQGSDGRWFHLVEHRDGAVGATNAVGETAMGETAAGETAAGETALEGTAVGAAGAAGEMVARLTAAGHAAHLVTTLPELMADPVAVARGLSSGHAIGVSPRLSRTPPTLGSPATRPGVDGRRVVEDAGCDWLDLVAAGAVVDIDR